MGARFVPTLFKNEKDWNNWRATIDKTPSLKRAWSRFVRCINEIIAKAKNYLSQICMTAEEKANAKKAIAELESIKRLYTDAYVAMMDKVEEKAISQNSQNDGKNNTNEAYNGNVSHSLKNNGKTTGESYTEKEYRNFGWARANNILNEGQNKDYRSKFADAKSGNAVFNKSKNGEYIIPVSDIYDEVFEGVNNVLVFAKGTITNPIITSVIEIYEFDETNLDRIRRRIYDSERRGIQQKAGKLFRRYFPSDFEFRPNQQRIGVESFGNSGNNGHGRRSSAETASIKEKNKVSSFLKDSDGNASTDEKPTNNPDTRFSLKKSVKENNAISKDTKKLLDTIESLKHEFEVTKFAKAAPKKLAEMTKELLKDYYSEADFDNAFANIDDLYTYMANGEDGHPAVWEEVYERATNVASRIVEYAVVGDDSTYKEYKELREYLRNTPISFNSEYHDVPRGYENFRDFYRRNLGKLKITKNGMAVDKVYQELAEMYPEYFDAHREITVTSMLERMVDVLDEIKPTSYNPFGSDTGNPEMQMNLGVTLPSELDSINTEYLESDLPTDAFCK